MASHPKEIFGLLARPSLPLYVCVSTNQKAPMKFTRTFACVAKSTLGFLLLLGSAGASAQEVIPDFYKEPGLSTSRDLTDQHEAEHIDPFTGSLQLNYTDIHVPGNGGFSLDVVRSYNSATVNETNPDAYVGQAGVGWTMHFGRVLSKFAPLPCTSTGFGLTVANNPVIETPDGSRQILNFVGVPTMVTSQFWKAECAAGGIGLVVYSPDGVRYDMTQQVNVSVGTLNQIAWYTTKITDRNGNYATISYAGVASAQISSVSTSDGRALSFTYTNGLIHTISTVGLGASTYTYNYTLVPGSTTSYELTSVSRPDATSWKYSYNPSLGSTAGSYVIKQVTFPEGGTLNYVYGYVYFDSSSNPASRSTVVKTKTSSDLGSWSFTYTPGAFGVYDTTVVTGPEGTETYKHIGPNYAQLGSVWQVGLLMSKTLGSIQTETYTWGKIKISNQTNMRPGAFSVRKDTEVDMPILTSKTIVRDGATHSLTVNSYDSIGKPIKTTETGPGGGSRVTTLGYYGNYALWIVEEPASQVVTGGSSVSKGFDSVGNVSSIVKDGVQTSYLRFPTGDIQQTTFPLNLVHTYANYKRGQAQSEAQPEGVYLTRVIDDVGNMTSYTNGESHTTKYAYDGLNRVKAITYPTGNAVAITFTATTKSAVRGALTETTSYDGFGRTSAITLGGGTTNYTTTYRYDAAGRLTFASNPSDTVGTTYGAFDVLGRYHSVKNADGSTRSISYGAGTKTVVNERAKSTTEAFLAYGDPDESYVVSVKAAEPTANVVIGRDAWNRVHTITQAGLTRTYNFNPNGYLTSVVQPEIGTLTYGRDAAGNMTSRTDGSGLNGATYSYDQQNRLSGESYSGSTPVRTTLRTYSRTNKLKTVSASGQWVSSIAYGYDPNDNLLTKALTVDSQTFTTTIGYNANDQVASLTYPYTNAVVNFTPDTLGRPTLVSGFVNSVAYWPSGQIKTITYGNQTVTSYGQNNRLWPSSFSTAMGATSYSNSGYIYDGVGNLTSITDSVDSSYSRTLGYDGIDRLTSASGPWGAGTIAYDGTGNIKSQNLGTYGLAYTYDSNNKLTALSGARASSFAYDSAGDITSAYGNTYAYDGVPNLGCVNCGNTSTQIQYGYDGNNKRLQVVKGNVTSYEIYGPHDNLLLEYTPSTGASTEYFYLGNKRVAQRVSLAGPVTRTYAGAPLNGTVGMSIPVGAAVLGTAAPWPTGTVNFYEGTTLLGAGSVDPATGFAATTVKFATTGSHTFTANYMGDAQNGPSSSAAQAVTIVSDTVVDVRPSPNSAGSPFFASVSVGSHGPTGVVSFYNNGILMGTATPDNATGIAKYSGIAAGTTPDSITATYPGDANNPAVSSIATTVLRTTNMDGFYRQFAFELSSPTAAVGQPFRIAAFATTNLNPPYTSVPQEPLPANINSPKVSSVMTGDTPIIGRVAYNPDVGVSIINVTFTTRGNHELGVQVPGVAPWLSTSWGVSVTTSP